MLVSFERVEPAPDGGWLLHLRSRVHGQDAATGDPALVLDWRFVAVVA